MQENTGQEIGERLIERLGEHNIEYVFATFGTDHPTLIKGLASQETPEPIIAPHEMAAASAAHGYAQAAGTPGVVLVTLMSVPQIWERVCTTLPVRGFRC